MTAPLDVTAAPVRTTGAGIRSDPAEIGTFFRPRLPRQNPPGGMGAWDSTNAGPVQVILTGPLLDPQGHLGAIIEGMLAAMAQAVGDQGLADVMYNLDRSIQFPTPYYETQITVQRQANDVVVHDRGIVYGPWLEGLSHRNQASRFRGYFAFRRAADELRRKAAGICERIGQQWQGRLDG